MPFDKTKLPPIDPSAGENPFKTLFRLYNKPIAEDIPGGKEALEKFAQPGLNDSELKAKLKGFASGALGAVNPALIAQAASLGSGTPATIANTAIAAQGTNEALDPTLPTWKRVLGGATGAIGALNPLSKIARLYKGVSIAEKAAQDANVFDVQPTAQPGGQVLGPKGKGVLPVQPIVPIRGTGAPIKAAPDVRTPEEIANDLARFQGRPQQTATTNIEPQPKAPTIKSEPPPYTPTADAQLPPKARTAQIVRDQSMLAKAQKFAEDQKNAKIAQAEAERQAKAIEDLRNTLTETNEPSKISTTIKGPGAEGLGTGRATITETAPPDEPIPGEGPEVPKEPIMSHPTKGRAIKTVDELPGGHKAWRIQQVDKDLFDIIPREPNPAPTTKADVVPQTEPAPVVPETTPKAVPPAPEALPEEPPAPAIASTPEPTPPPPAPVGAGVPMPEVMSDGLPASPAADIAANAANPSPVAQLLAMPEANPTHPDHAIWQQLREKVVGSEPQAAVEPPAPAVGPTEPPTKPPLPPTAPPYDLSRGTVFNNEATALGNVKFVPGRRVEQVGKDAWQVVEPEAPLIETPSEPTPIPASPAPKGGSKGGMRVGGKKAKSPFLTKGDLMAEKLARFPPKAPETFNEGVARIQAEKAANPENFPSGPGLKEASKKMDETVANAISKLPPASTPRLVKNGKVVDLPRQEAPLPPGAGVPAEPLKPMSAGPEPPAIINGRMVDRATGEVVPAPGYGAPVEPGVTFPKASGDFPEGVYEPPRTAEEAGAEYDRIKKAKEAGYVIPEGVRAAAGAEAKALANAEKTVSSGALKPNGLRVMATNAAKKLLSDESGQAAVGLNAHLGLGALGGAVGYAEDPLGNRPLSAAAGAGLGLAGIPAANAIAKGLPTLAKGYVAAQPSAEKALDLLNKLHNTGLLSLSSVGKKGIADIQGLIQASIEHPTAGREILNQFLSPEGRALMAQNFKEGFRGPAEDYAKQGLENFIQGGGTGLRDLPGNILSSAGRTMGGLTKATKGIMGQAGLTPEQQGYYTLTSYPTTNTGKKVLQAIQGSKILQHFSPFAKIGINRLERGIEYSPLGMLSGKGKNADEVGNMALKAGLGTTAGALAYQNTDKDFVKNHPVLAGTLAAGPMGIPMLAGMAAKAAKGENGELNTVKAFTKASQAIGRDIPGLHLLEDLESHPEGFARNYLSGYTNFSRPIATALSPDEPDVSSKNLPISGRIFNRALSNVPGIRETLPKKSGGPVKDW